jgi:hypothetical protein
MRLIYCGLLTAALLAVAATAFGQGSFLLAKCLGEPLSSYAKAFGDTFTSVEKTPSGKVTVGQYKTGGGMIEVRQKAGEKRPLVVNVHYYQEPKLDWKLALQAIGLSSTGVTAKSDAKHWVHLSHIKASKPVRIEAVYIPLGPANSNGPELHITLR